MIRWNIFSDSHLFFSNFLEHTLVQITKYILNKFHVPPLIIFHDIRERKIVLKGKLLHLFYIQERTTKSLTKLTSYRQWLYVVK